MSIFSHHPILTHSAKWSLHGTYYFADGQAHSLEGYMQSDVDGNRTTMHKVLWVLAEKPYKAHLLFNLQTVSDKKNITLEGEHSELGLLHGCVLGMENCLTLHFRSPHVQGSELFIRDAQDTYRAYGSLSVHCRQFGGWTAVYKIQK